MLGIVGAGAQAELMLLGLHELRQHRQFLVHDLDSHHAAQPVTASRHRTTSPSEEGSYAVTLSVASVSSSKVISGAGRRKPLVRTAR